MVSLPLWSRVLAYPRPPRLSTQTNIAIRKAVGTFSKVQAHCTLEYSVSSEEAVMKSMDATVVSKQSCISCNLWL